jgi:hypothetical protein
VGESTTAQIETFPCRNSYAIDTCGLCDYRDDGKPNMTRGVHTQDDRALRCSTGGAHRDGVRSAVTRAPSELRAGCALRQRSTRCCRPDCPSSSSTIHLWVLYPDWRRSTPSGTASRSCAPARRMSPACRRGFGATRRRPSTSSCRPGVGEADPEDDDLATRSVRRLTRARPSSDARSCASSSWTCSHEKMREQARPVNPCGRCDKDCRVCRHVCRMRGPLGICLWNSSECHQDTACLAAVTACSTACSRRQHLEEVAAYDGHIGDASPACGMAFTRRKRISSTSATNVSERDVDRRRRRTTRSEGPSSHRDGFSELEGRNSKQPRRSRRRSLAEHAGRPALNVVRCNSYTCSSIRPSLESRSCSNSTAGSNALADQVLLFRRF